MGWRSLLKFCCQMGSNYMISAVLATLFWHSAAFAITFTKELTKPLLGRFQQGVASARGPPDGRDERRCLTILVGFASPTVKEAYRGSSSGMMKSLRAARGHPPRGFAVGRSREEHPGGQACQRGGKQAPIDCADLTFVQMSGHRPRKGLIKPFRVGWI